MKSKPILALVSLCLAATAPRVAEAASPFAWLGLGKSSTSHASMKEVSSSSPTPSTLSRMSSGTKRLVSNTKKMFVPAKPPVKRRGVTATHKAENSEPPKQNFVQRLFYSEPTPPPKTVNEWMRLKQVHP